MTKPICIIILIIICGCSNRAVLFEDLPDSCINCKVEIIKYNAIDCLSDSLKPITNSSDFIIRLKKLNYYPIDNPDIGLTNDMNIIILDNDSIILNLSIWVENGFSYILKNGNYYYSLCESLEYLFKN